ncbi:MAG: hypothetical protein L0229_26325 [Blastocatellia bacterium]|nr:hypothetical protein [Blastocatellia bacterium]
MYCPSCGVECLQGLKYCKHCGANLSGAASSDEPRINFSKVAGMFWPIAAVCIVGIIGLLITVTEMARMNFEPKFLLGIVAFISAMIFGVVGLMIWLLLRLTDIHHKSDQKPDDRAQKEHSPLRLPDTPFAVPSVTEHTTRNFEPQAKPESGAEERKRESSQRATR